MRIPYTTDVRPDTGMTSPQLGMWLFLASEVMLFGSLFSSYALLRSGAQTWPDQTALLNVPLATTNTAILLASSAAILGAGRAIRSHDVSRCRRYLAATVTCGIVFLLLKSVEYRQELARGLLPSTNNFLGLYFTMTGLHALHIVAGVGVNLHLWTRGARMWAAEPLRFVGRVEAAGVYWNFVDLVWLTIFLVLYLL